MPKEPSLERVRLVDWLKSERDQHVGGGLYYNSQILFAYNSNHMEGSTLSPEQTAQLFNTGALLPDNINDEIRADDVAETTNHFNAFNWALDHVDDPVNKSLVCFMEFSNAAPAKNSTPTATSADTK